LIGDFINTEERGMTYYGGKEMAAAFRTVRANTITIAEEIPESQYEFRPASDARTIGKTLVHIALGPRFQHHVHSNRIDSLTKVNFPVLVQEIMTEEAKPRSKAEIIELLTSEGEKFAAFLESVSEALLAEPVGMPPGADPATKSRFEMLLSPKEHEMHHRGQLMTFQRMIGQVPHLTRRMQERMAQSRQATTH
jgi:uncharacterized damage-inducible protein DinB